MKLDWKRMAAAFFAISCLFMGRIFTTNADFRAEDIIPPAAEETTDVHEDITEDILNPDGEINTEIPGQEGITEYPNEENPTETPEDETLKTPKEEDIDDQDSDEDEIEEIEEEELPLYGEPPEGITVTGTGGETVTEGENYSFTTGSGKTINIISGNITISGTNSSEDVFIDVNDGYSGTLTLDGLSIKSSSQAIPTLRIRDNTSLNIVNSSSFNVNHDTCAGIMIVGGKNLNVSGSGTLTITGSGKGIVFGDANALSEDTVNSGSLELSGANISITSAKTAIQGGNITLNSGTINLEATTGYGINSNLLSQTTASTSFTANAVAGTAVNVNTLSYTAGKFRATGNTCAIRAVTKPDIPNGMTISTSYNTAEGAAGLLVYPDGLIEYNSTGGAYILSMVTSAAKTAFIGSYTPPTPQRTDISPTVSMEGWTYGGSANDPVVGGTKGDGTPVFTYYKNQELTTQTTTSDGASGSGQKPANAGTYWVKVTIPQTVNYNEGEASTSFTISKAVHPAITVSVSDVEYGTAPSPSVSAGLQSGDSPTYKYKEKDAQDSTYIDTLPSAAGSYTVKVTIPASANYNEISNEANFDITKREVTVTWSNTSLTYNGTEQAPTATVSNKIGSDEVNVTVTGGQTDAGTDITATASALTGKDSANYKLPDTKPTQTYSIIKTDHPAITVSVSSIEYGATPAPSVSGLVSGDASATYKYKVKGQDDSTYTDTVPEAVGSYTVKATIPDSTNYNEISNEADFDINQREVTITWSNTSLTFDGTIQAPTATVSNKVGSDEVNVTVTGGQIESGTGLVATADALTGADSANYKLPTTKPTTQYSIAKEAHPAITVSVSNIEYGATPSPSVSAGLESGDIPVYKYKVKDAQDSTYTDTAPKAAGSYTVKATIPASENYGEISGEANFDITKKEVSISWSNTSLTYDGTEKKPTANVNNKAYADDEVEITVIGGQVNAGTDLTATADALTGADSANYKLPTTKPTTTYSIAKADAPSGTPTTKEIAAKIGATDTGTITPALLGITFDGASIKEITGAPNASIVGITGNDYTFAGADSTGTTTVTAVVESTNYSDVNVAITFKVVDKEPVTISGISMTKQEYAYGETVNYTGTPVSKKDTTPVSVPENDYEYTYYNAVGDTPLAEAPTAIGSYYLKVSIKDTNTDYLGSSDNIAFTITKADMNPTLTMTGWSYKDTPKTPSVAGIEESAAVTYTYKLKSEADTEYKTYNAETSGSYPIEVGTYTLRAVVADTTNYNGKTLTKDFEITPKDISSLATITLEQSNYDYTGSAITPVATVSYNSSDLTLNADYTVSYTSNTDAGTATINVIFKGNYTGSKSATFVINKIDATVTPPVIADDSEYNTKVQSLISKSGSSADGTVKYSVNGGEFSASTPTATNAGSYTIKYMVEGDKNHNNYAPVELGTVQITALDISDGVVSLLGGLIYDGTEKTQEFALVVGDITIPVTDLTVTGNKNTSAGKYKFTIEGKAPNCVGMIKDIEYSIIDINKADISVSDTVVEKGVPVMNISTAKDELIKALAECGAITPEELVRAAAGEKLTVGLNIKEEVSKEDKERILKEVSAKGEGYKVGMYLDITLVKKIGNDPSSLITNAGTDIAVQFEMPKAIINTDPSIKRTHWVVRDHSGTIDFLTTKYDSKTNIVTFYTDRFSPYALVYQDEDLRKTPIDAAVNTISTIAKSPSTGFKEIARNPMWGWPLYVIIALLLSCALLNVKKKK